MKFSKKNILKYYICVLSAAIPSFILLFVLIFIVDYFQLKSVCKLEFRSLCLGIFILVNLLVAIPLCKIWGSMLLKLGLLSVEEANKFPFKKL